MATNDVPINVALVPVSSAMRSADQARSGAATSNASALSEKP